MCNAYCIVTSFPPLAVVVKAERESPAPCEVQSAIRLLKAKTFIPAEIHRKIVEGYGESAIQEGNVMKWCRLFKKWGANVHEEERSEHPSSVTDDLKGKVQGKFRKNKQFTLYQLHEHSRDACRCLVQENITN